jgi:hypothetical protein
VRDKPEALSLIPVSCPFRDLSPCSWRPGSSGSLHPAADKIHHTYTPDGNRIRHLGYGSFWLLSSSIYKVEWVFSAAAGAENLAQSTSKSLLSKIADICLIREMFEEADPQLL